jgi:hypothetical protein
MIRHPILTGIDAAEHRARLEADACAFRRARAATHDASARVSRRFGRRRENL